jgi:2,4-dienoyl-CoA reductase-like NADH-dependent reductase (Old Yellow Enzyme family)
VGLTARDSEGKRRASKPGRSPNISIEDIHSTISAFGHAASDAKRIGIDIIEVHGAYGYLIDQFFSSVTNQGTDEYGRKTIQERRETI